MRGDDKRVFKLRRKRLMRWYEAARILVGSNDELVEGVGWVLWKSGMQMEVAMSRDDRASMAIGYRRLRYIRSALRTML